MNKVVLFLLAIVASLSLEAQINTPAASPSSKLVQMVGLTEVVVDYSRPSMRGRTVFGDLVPYGKLWRTGANSFTKVTFSTDVTIGDKVLKAGSYGVFSKPGEKTWEVIFYTESDGWGTPGKWDESKVAATATVPTYPIEVPIETFTITIDDVTTKGANLGIMWDHVYVGVPFEVPTDKAVMDNIDKVLSGPGAGDYYAAAVYYLSEGKDIKKAKDWMDKAMAMTENPAYWQLRQQSLILAKSGDKKGAIEAAKASLAKAQEAGNGDYVKMNQDSLKEWGAK